jgi:hypothetical protein
MRKSLLLIGAGLMILCSTTGAQAQHAGQWGLGLLTTSAPVGVFYGINDKTNLHVGFGFKKNDLPEASTATETEFTIGGAVSFDIWQASGMGFGVLPSIFYTNMSPKTGDSSSATLIGIYLQGHWDPNDWASLWFRHGFDIMISSPAGGDSTTDFGTSGVDLGSFGVTFWLPSRS